MSSTRGLWFEEERNRWRVRLYKDKSVFWLSYHETEDEALDTMERAKGLRSKYKKLNTKAPVLEPSTKNLISNLRAKENHQVDYENFCHDHDEDTIILFTETPCAQCYTPTLGVDNMAMSSSDHDKISNLDIIEIDMLHPTARMHGSTLLCELCSRDYDL